MTENVARPVKGRARLTPAMTALGAVVIGVILIGLAAWILAPTGFGPDPNAPVVFNHTAVPPVPTLNPERVAAGAARYAQSCAACHGADLQGAPNWKQRLPTGALPPPPHDDTGHTWHHPDPVFLSIVTHGGDPAYGGVMPGFAATLTEDQMTDILDFIKSRWSREHREYQWWMTVTTQGSQP